MKIIAFLGLLGFAGCGHEEPLPVCSGPIIPLNAGRWTPTQADLRMPPPIRPGQ